MSKGKIKSAAKSLKSSDGGTFESCLDNGTHALEINKWLLEVSWEVANKGESFAFFFYTFGIMSNKCHFIYKYSSKKILEGACVVVLSRTLRF